MGSLSCDFHLELSAIPLPIMAMFHAVAYGWTNLGIFACLSSGLWFFSNVVFLALLFWVTGDPRPVLPTELFLVWSPFSMIMDIVFLSVCTKNITVHSEGIFSIVIACIDLVVKPLTTWFVFKEFRSRGGRFICEGDAGASGYSSLPGEHD
jgi:FtsH-binding integral membrane protein